MHPFVRKCGSGEHAEAPGSAGFFEGTLKFSVRELGAEGFIVPTPWENLSLMPAGSGLGELHGKLESRYKIYKLPASFCAPTPAPEEVREFTRAQALKLVEPATVGDLIPMLRQIPSHTSLYPWSGDLQPSWARLARTAGPFALQIGLDSMLAAIVTGDFGVTAKSKAHYCEISHDEIAAAAEKL